jgi:hypothetical protein
MQLLEFQAVLTNTGTFLLLLLMLVNWLRIGESSIPSFPTASLI